MEVIWKLVKELKKVTIWHTQFVFALLTGLMGCVDAESSQNVFIPMGTWFILVGCMGLWAFTERKEKMRRLDIHTFALFISMAFLVYSPSTVIVSSRARSSYAEFINVLKKLNGSVYAPSLGQLQHDYTFYPAATWVALQVMIRKPGSDRRNHKNTLRLLEPAISPKGPAYVFSNDSIDEYAGTAFLGDYYALVMDFGDRFKPLKALPRRWDTGWPRYLYRYVSSPITPQ
jgi:hypothetical protein